jgi:hypothetical protein
MRARDDWASGDAMRADAAAALAREAFTAAWAQAAEDRQDADKASTTERLPVVHKEALPTPQSVSDALTKVGLAASIREADGAPAVWQVTVSDPTGSSSAGTEFWAWPDTKSGGALPTVQALPPNAPELRRYGPEAVGGLVSTRDGQKAYLASAWGRPRSRGGLEVALAERKLDAQARYAITANAILPVEADSVALVAAPGGGAQPPSLLVTGAGERDLLFDDCPTCPHLDRVQLYAYTGGSWHMAEEHVRATPYAAWVSFLHALRDGTPDSALPYVTDASVLDEARKLGLDHHTGALRAMPGTSASDVTQRYRIAGGAGVEVTLEPRGDHWVVGDLRPTSTAIE